MIQHLTMSQSFQPTLTTITNTIHQKGTISLRLKICLIFR